MRAASIDAQGYARWRLRAGRATVHSVFERVVNLRGEGGDLFTVAAAGIDDAPDTLVADEPLPVAGLAPGDAVDAGQDRLVAGAIDLPLAGARPWRAVLPVYPACPARMQRHLVVVREALAAGREPGSSGSRLGRELAAALASHAEPLCAALAAGDRDGARRHGQALLGLGPGLTPAGDDFLAGLLVVLHLPGGPGRALLDVGPDILAAAGCRTNAISVAMLRAAAQGRVRECVIALLRELVAGDPQSVATALARVLAIGSTSGRDMAAGVVAGFDVQARLGSARIA